MWYRSMVTNRILHGSAARIINNLYGDGYFEKLVTSGVLTAMNSPTVVDVLKYSGSNTLANLRYREIFGCTFKEAQKGVNLLKKDIDKGQSKKKPHKKHWKKYDTLTDTKTPEETTNTEDEEKNNE